MCLMSDRHFRWRFVCTCFFQRNLLGSGCGLTLVPWHKCLYNNKGVVAPSGGRLCVGDAVIVGSPAQMFV